MIPPHGHPLCWVGCSPGTFGFCTGGTFKFVHHDKNKAESRVVTVLVYLTTLPGEGQTIFPCFGEQGGPSAEPDICVELKQAFHEG